MKKTLSLILCVLLLTTFSFSLAETSQFSSPPPMPEGMEPGTPPAKPEGEMPGGFPGQPPEGMEFGQPPEGMGQPPQKPDDGMPVGMPGGGHSAPTEYAAVYSVTEDTEFTGEHTSNGVDENLLHVSSGNAVVTDAVILRQSGSSTGGDSSSFYGIGAAVLSTGGTVSIRNSSITTDASGGTGVFAYGDGVVFVSDSTITTAENTSGGIHVAGGGTLYASNLTVETSGESAAAIRSDRGSGLMIVEGGRYTSHGVGSPAVYVTADISIHDADLAATGSEALCMEGLNTVRLFDCSLSGSMQDLSQNDNTWTVIVYQSMSGDSQIGKGHFEMSGGNLTSTNGGLFYTTNTESEFILSDVAITAAEGCEYFLRCTGNSNQRGWGRSGGNGANCIFTGIRQAMTGDILWDSISTLDLYATQGSTLTGAIINDESCAGEGGRGYCALYIDETSRWTVTGNSRLTSLYCAGSIADAEGNTVTIVDAGGNVLEEGTSPYTITVEQFSSTADMQGAGQPSNSEEHRIPQ
ncbi:MAG: hypothetical protein E7331_02440 [Clostridiales bacterium]|nr:hypothetical protein [Clostridiales bacterium]